MTDEQRDLLTKVFKLWFIDKGIALVREGATTEEIDIQMKEFTELHVKTLKAFDE